MKKEARRVLGRSLAQPIPHAELGNVSAGLTTVCGSGSRDAEGRWEDIFGCDSADPRPPV